VCQTLDSRLGDLASFQNLFLHIVRLSVRVNTPGKALSIMELRILDRLVKINSATQPRQYMLSHYLTKLAQLGGYLARNSDPPPGNETIWRGLTRLIDIQLGDITGAEIVGN
jgi:hypothetical protein